MKTGTKILIGNWFIVILFIALGTFCFINIKELRKNTYKEIDNHLTVKNIIEIKTLITDLESIEKEFLITGEDDLISPYKKTEERLTRKVKETEERLRNKNNSEESDWIEKIIRLIQQWNEIASKEIEIKNKIKILINSETDSKLMNELEKEIDNFIDKEMINFRKSENTNESVPVLIKKNIEIRLLLSDLKNVVSRFLLTGESEYLLEYSEKKEKISDHINEINSLLPKDNQEHLRYIRKIKELSENWYETAASKTEIRKESDSLISKGPGREIIKELYNEFEAFIAYKENLFTEYREHNIKKEEEQTQILPAIAGIAFLLATLISLIIARNIKADRAVSEQSPCSRKYEIKEGIEVYKIANAINDSVGEMTKITALLQEVSDSLKKKHQKWDME